VREVDIARVDGIGDIAAARADEQHAVISDAFEITFVALDALRGRVGHAVHERGETRQLGWGGEVVLRFRGVVPGDVHAAVPRAGRGAGRDGQQAESQGQRQKHTDEPFHPASSLFCTM